MERHCLSLMESEEDIAINCWESARLKPPFTALAVRLSKAMDGPKPTHGDGWTKAPGTPLAWSFI